MEEGKDDPISNHSINVAALHERIKGSPGASEAVSRNPDFEVINFRGALWNFTQAGHPAHPSVACRRIVQIDGQMRVETQLHCSAAKAACDRLAESYRALDREMMEAIKQQQPKR